MRVTVDRRSAATAAVAIVGVLERGGDTAPFPAALSEADALAGGLVRGVWGSGELTGRRKELLTLHRPDGRGRLLLVGLGPRAALSVETLRRAAAEAVKALKGKKAPSVAFDLPSFVGAGVRPPEAAAALAEGAILGSYEFVRYRPAKEPPVEEASIALGRQSGAAAAIGRAVDRSRALAESVRWTREIANLPADTATPEHLASEAVALGKELGLKVTVYDEKQLKAMRCGGLLGVGGGSSHPPRLVIVDYPGRGRSPPTVAVVGKGITFDSGGISIKPSLHLSEMKFDKSGAVAVLGILRAAATLKLAPRVVGVLACAENLPSGTAYRPGDVVTTYNGKTIEVLNTDAEGRVVLADALGLVVDRYHPAAVVDLATLTGACVVALGDDTAGLITAHLPLRRALEAAAASSGEPVWSLPLTDYHRDLVQSEVADVRNSTEMPPAGALTATAFLETFVGRAQPWAHLDIAGPAWTNGGTRRFQPAYQPIGATGFGVRLVTHFLERFGRPVRAARRGGRAR